MPRVAAESYQALQSWLRFALPPDRQRVILVTSAVDGERTSSVVAGLGRALARAGHRTLLVSADLRFPKLHELFDRGRRPGFADALAFGAAAVESAIVAVGPHLDLLPSGSASNDPAALLSGDAIDEFFSLIGRLDYSYVLVESSPLLGVADTHGLARRVENVLLVSRLERLTFDDVVEARDALQRLQITPLGLVVVDTEPPGEYAYAAARLVSPRP
jgi:Mrp family chromosome partitioning ATPase